MAHFPVRLALSSLLVASLGGCADTGGESIINPSGKTDSAWIGADTFEVNATVRSQAQEQAIGSWEDLANDEALQADLVDLQLKFMKNAVEAEGWRFNQLAEAVSILSVTTDGGLVTIEYEATVDFLGRFSGDLPTLADIPVLEFVARAPLDPNGFTRGDIADCSKSDDGHSAAEYNFHYYFAPELASCAIPMAKAELEITEVFNRPTVYPEYDKLMQDLGDGTVGFTAALVPNRGDDDPMSRYNAHARMLEDDLGLGGVLADDETYTRYTWEEGQVRLTVDLYDPTQVNWDFAKAFRERLGTYTLIHYNGHSAYGTKHLLDEPESFSDQYQIIMVHSCQSYAYYSRQVFRAKETAEDSTGFALADVVATGKSSYPSGSPPTVRVLLSNLQKGMVAIRNNEAEYAPSWLAIAERMKASTFGDIMYGVAGARTNSWQP